MRGGATYPNALVRVPPTKAVSSGGGGRGVGPNDALHHRDGYEFKSLHPSGLTVGPDNTIKPLLGVMIYAFNNILSPCA